ncbi:hypothetical protein WN943_022602 [Citrus x changshan-huyou]
MENTSQVVEVYSSRGKLSSFMNFKKAGSSNHEDEWHFSKKFLKDSEASGSNEAAKKLLVNCSTRKMICSYSRKGKEILQANIRVEELNERLNSLEVENEAMKQAFIETLEERNKLVQEIYRDFQKLHQRHRLGNQVTGLKIWDESIIVNSSYEAVMGSGLSQVLFEESNPCIVTRDHSANLHFTSRFY